MRANYDIPWHMLVGLDPHNDQVFTLKASVCSGLEPQARDEIATKLRSVAYIARGRVFFDVKARDIDKALKLRSVEHLNVVVYVNQKFGFVKDKEACMEKLRQLPRHLTWDKCLTLTQRVLKFPDSPNTRRSDAQLQLLDMAAAAPKPPEQLNALEMLRAMRPVIVATVPTEREPDTGQGPAQDTMVVGHTAAAGDQLGGEGMPSNRPLAAQNIHAADAELKTTADVPDDRGPEQDSEPSPVDQGPAQDAVTPAVGSSTVLCSDADPSVVEVYTNGSSTADAALNNGSADGAREMQEMSLTMDAGDGGGAQTLTISVAEHSGAAPPADCGTVIAVHPPAALETAAPDTAAPAADRAVVLIRADSVEREMLRRQQQETGAEVSVVPTAGQAVLGAGGSGQMVPDDGVAVPSFRVTCLRSGDGKRSHAFESQHGSESFGGAVQQLFGWRVKMKQYDIEVVLSIDFDMVSVSLALTREPLFRRNLVKMGPTSLRATFCHNMLMMARPKPWEVVVDPLCGGGSISLEGAQAFPGTYHICGDNYPDAAPRAALNRAYCAEQRAASESNGAASVSSDVGLPAVGTSDGTEQPPVGTEQCIADASGSAVGTSTDAELPAAGVCTGATGSPRQLSMDILQWDACRLPLRDSIADIVVTDLPFGKRIGSRHTNHVLYPLWLEEMARICVPRYGRAVVLTQDRTTMEKVLNRASVRQMWRVRSAPRVNIGGLTGCVYMLARSDYTRRTPSAAAGSSPVSNASAAANEKPACVAPTNQLSVSNDTANDEAAITEPTEPEHQSDTGEVSVPASNSLKVLAHESTNNTVAGDVLVDENAVRPAEVNQAVLVIKEVEMPPIPVINVGAAQTVVLAGGESESAPVGAGENSDVAPAAVSDPSACPVDAGRSDKAEADADEAGGGDTSARESAMVHSADPSLTEVSAHQQPAESVSTNQNPLGDISTNQEPSGDVSINQEPAGDISTNQEPSGDVSTNQEPAGYISTNQEPSGDVSTNQEPAGYISTNQEPSGDVSTNQEPSGEISTNQEPAGDISTNQEPSGDVSTNQEPAGDISTNQEPSGDVSTNQEPAGNISTNQEPVGELSADKEPVLEVSTNQEPVTDSSISQNVAKSADPTNEVSKATESTNQDIPADI